MIGNMDNANAAMRHTAIGQVIGASPTAGVPLCPRCNGALIRIQRRPIDRLISVFVPVDRFRCAGRNGKPDCSWSGNLPMQEAHDDQVSQIPFGDMSFGDMAQITLNAIGDAVLVVDPAGKVIYLNKVAETLTGWTSATALGRSVEDVFYIVDGTTRDRAISPSQRAIEEGQIVELELGSVLIRKDGTDLEIEDSAAPILNRLGRIVGAVIVFHDARESRSVKDRMSHLAQHDCLTGLPNRMLLTERLTQAIGMASRRHKQVALLFLDLDNFKEINDAFGHAVGDHFLREAAADIVSCVRATDTVSRLGGDEFVILLTEIEARQDAAHVAEKLLEKFAAPRIIDGQEMRVTLSIGISCYPDNGLDAGELMQNADSAMYITKNRGRNSFQFCHGQDEGKVRRTFT